MRRAAKVDDNQKGIVEGLRKNGCFVQPLAPVGKGVPDLLVGKFGKWFVLEVKDGGKVISKRKLTDSQVEWLIGLRNRADVHVVESIEEALAVVSTNQKEWRTCPNCQSEA